jgi:hypothetical protein
MEVVGMRVALCVALCGALVFSVGCSQGVSAADAEALSLGMTVEEMEAEVGSEFVVAEEQVLLGSTITVGYFGDPEAAHIAVVLTDGAASRIELVGLD